MLSRFAIEEGRVVWPGFLPGYDLALRVSSPEEAQALLAALETVVGVEVRQGAQTLSPEALRSLENDTRCCAVVWNVLTTTQREVLRGIAQGLSTEEIAAQQRVAEATVHSHKTAILAHCRRVWQTERPIGLDFLWLKFAPFLE